MNERIHELIELASKEITTYYPGLGNITETYFDKQKFAKLIVKECAKIVTIWSEEEPCSEGYDITPVHKMKEHFGVEE